MSHSLVFVFSEDFDKNRNGFKLRLLLLFELGFSTSVSGSLTRFLSKDGPNADSLFFVSASLSEGERGPGDLSSLPSLRLRRTDRPNGEVRWFDSDSLGSGFFVSIFSC